MDEFSNMNAFLVLLFDRSPVGVPIDRCCLVLCPSIPGNDVVVQLFIRFRSSQCLWESVRACTQTFNAQVNRCVGEEEYLWKWFAIVLDSE